MMRAIGTEGPQTERRHPMGARQKLNVSYFTGSLLVAAGSGWLTGSWIVFVVVLVVLMVLNLQANEIRPTRRHDRNQGRD
jgi:hypothetical protein